MRRSFYQWLMTQRDPVTHDEVKTFANGTFFDQSFPKQSTDFDEISRYLEENGSYLQSMDIFDAAWRQYLASEE
ncbi:YozE family protein [Weissella coleopterorum]|uniref:UPF0346 protein G7084_04295 n=1 Tax=Weissella coleopterorum TaxID=2714949 RepID=A0A6G8AZV9_9LACO|nr:YozE family protein [Weissella coleopterorum]QIL50598.1 YozE family protein [Weissella coleopterorum]